MDLWQLIARDHEKIAQLIRDIPYALNGSGVIRSRERLLGDLMDELEAHAVALEAALYAPLRTREKTAGLVDALRGEHRTFMKRLGALMRFRLTGTAGWLDGFEDATFLVDQHLHRHTHELLPQARALLSSDEIEAARHAFVRAKLKALRAQRRGAFTKLGSGEWMLTATVGAAAAGLAYLAWQRGLLRGTPARN
ncbi:hemerythrin domain-containing protein [Methylobacterium oxalidis]|uniref:Hemerythrin-like domain-containing protein n=1 Tax=Methylobacterium oxalidis TaxID=944322 RepID=A0A512J8Q5_9HYPH|nr:hemerythrin domain-containing protein [Methylobacterium oxalidis]GEP06341.1 hypothetical protein MOX02_43790 [Methylobacterium oxalidis]GJE29907.1 hypothetical protein LDDCCGHA_0070 [Methylobacterium oxalidis]GLS62466.1 hypothetical protein GCM10007888_08470 [Methylobacterium oxalidis]